MINLMVYLNRLKKNRFFYQGVPFLVFLVGGSFALKQFTSIRYEVHELKDESNELSNIFKVVDFEKEAPKMLSEVDHEHWENVRAPRPYEDNSEYLKHIEKRIQEEKKKRRLI